LRPDYRAVRIKPIRLYRFGILRDQLETGLLAEYTIAQTTREEVSYVR